MFKFIYSLSALATAALFSTAVFAMEPLVAIQPNDAQYNYYSSVANMDQKLVNEGLIEYYHDIGQDENSGKFNVRGRVVPLADGSRSNPYNLVVTVNGNLYYVDAILNSVDSIGIRRRLRDNPEPGIFLRIEGRRVNPEDGRAEIVQVWLKIATPQGRALPVLKILEGNYDLAELPPPEPLLPKLAFVQEPGLIQPATYLPGNPGPILPPPFQRASELLNGLTE